MRNKCYDDTRLIGERSKFSEKKLPEEALIGPQDVETLAIFRHTTQRNLLLVETKRHFFLSFSLSLTLIPSAFLPLRLSLVCRRKGRSSRGLLSSPLLLPVALGSLLPPLARLHRGRQTAKGDSIGRRKEAVLF